MRKKQMTRLSLMASLFLVVAVISCKRDDLRSRELLIFLPGDYGAVDNSITASLTRTPLSVWGNTKFNVSVAATREVPADVDVYIKADTSVARYNEANRTNYLLLPSTAFTISESKRTIASGKMVSDPINIEITDATLLTDTKGYILPISIEKIASKDRGALLSTNQSTVYLVIPYQYTNVDSVEAPVAGTVMARTGWSVTVSNSSSGTANQASNILDGNNATVWRSSNSSTAAKTITLNMGSVQTVKGFRITPNYTNVNENATQITVSTSADNITFTPQGIWRGTGPAAGSSAAAPDNKGINFLVPVQARYFRFDINAWVSTNVVGVAEINAVQ